MRKKPLDVPQLREDLRKATDLNTGHEGSPWYYCDPDELFYALDRLESVEAKVAAVRELHTKEKHGVRWYCGECLQDDNTGGWDYVEYPCPTIRTLGVQ